ncbi:AIR synthase family protein [Algoriphagus aestuarii]|nr:AIR synthase family protein [Algoriphagus aestuarii]
MGAFENTFGKISAEVFKEDLLNSCGAQREEVICGPRFGVDTSVVDLGNGDVLAISSDPLSLIPGLGMKVSAWLSVHLLANDMSTTGFAPQFAQFVLNLPLSLSREDFQVYWQHIHALCEEMGISITGGHTGQIPGIDSTIAGGGTFFLKAPKNQVLTSNQAKAGDTIIMTKHAAISSTSLLAMAFPETVQEKLGVKIQHAAADNFWKLSVLKEAVISRQTLSPTTGLHAMHDVTEGGVLGAVQEMAIASGLGFEVIKDLVPVPNEVRQVADLFGIDPLLSIGAGAMIMAVAAGSVAQLIDKLAQEGIPATAIGNLTQSPEQILIDSAGNRSRFEFNGIDPYWEAFFNAIQQGKK